MNLVCLHLPRPLVLSPWVLIMTPTLTSASVSSVSPVTLTSTDTRSELRPV